MTRLFILAASLITLASVSVAQTVRVRSGEHDGYTRLVVQIPLGTGWVMTPQRRGARLSIALESVEFETETAFDRLSAGRLRGLTQSEPGAALEIDFGCECIATAFLHHQTMVVVDIRPGEYTPPPDPVSLPSLLPNPGAQRRSVAAEQIQSAELSLPLLHLKRRNFETQLMSRILQGADHDVVDLNLAGVGARQSGYFGPIQLPVELPGNLHISSILDELQGVDTAALEQVDTRPVCIANTELGFQDWSGSQAFPQQVANLRTDLFHEFDRLDTDAAEKLAKLYAYHGFGAEAVQTLMLTSHSKPKWTRIATIARLMDGEDTAPPNPFLDQQRCGGDAALWAVLTEGQLAKDAEANEIEQAFGRLPRHLRRQFGPVLSGIFVEANELEASRRILRSVERVDEGDRPEVALAQADVAAAEGNDARTEELLTKAATAPKAKDEAPLALARLIEKRWSDRGAISGQELELVAAHAIQFRNSEIGPMMARSHALALGLNQEFGAALNIMRASAGGKDWRRTQDQLLQLLAERADDVTFLRHALALPPEKRDAMTLNTAVAFSERLTRLGFGALGYELAGRTADNARHADRSLLRAQASLLQNRPRQALLELSGNDSDTAQRLRARVLIDGQDFAGAALVLKKIGDIEEANRNLWRAGLPEEIGDDTQGSYGTLSQLSHSLTRPISRKPGKPLADAAGLLQDSAEMRSEIGEVFLFLGEKHSN